MKHIRIFFLQKVVVAVQYLIALLNRIDYQAGYTLHVHFPKSMCSEIISIEEVEL
jgi:hypothetical protein